MNDSDKIWADDKLGRREDAELIRRFIIAQLDIREKIAKPRTFVLNLDSQWGGGKTFFLKRFKLDLEREGHIVASVNAWKDDHLDDPLIAVVSAIKDSLTEHLKDKGKSEKLKPLVKNAGLIVTKSFLGWAKQNIKNQIGDDAFAEAADIVTEQTLEVIGGNVLKGFEKQQDTIKSFRKDLAKLASAVFEESGKQAPLFVLIDELDRCRPDYAIKLLERIKHLFSVENIVFVVATDTGQLSNAVSGAYGSNFDGKRYLKRFFDRSYHFADASKADFIAATFDELGMDEGDFSVPLNMPVVGFLEHVCNLTNIQLRDIKQMLERTQTFASIWPYPDIKINLAILFPMIFQIHTSGYKNLNDENAMHNCVIQYPVDQRDPNSKLAATTLSSIQKQMDKHTNSFLTITAIGRSTNDVYNWGLDQLLSEYGARKKNNAIRGDLRFSVLLEYPKLLQQLAKLDDTTRDEA